jgi:hypothetical protein
MWRLVSNRRVNDGAKSTSLHEKNHRPVPRNNARDGWQNHISPCLAYSFAVYPRWSQPIMQPTIEPTCTSCKDLRSRPTCKLLAVRDSHRLKRLASAVQLRPWPPCFSITSENVKARNSSKNRAECEEHSPFITVTSLISSQSRQQLRSCIHDFEPSRVCLLRIRYDREFDLS